MVEYTYIPTLPLVKTYLIINCVVVFLTLLVVVLRMTSRIVTGSKLGWDDGLTLFAMPQGIGLLVLQAMWSQMGIGYTGVEPEVNTDAIWTLSLPFEILFATSTMFIKLSILLFYLRVFKGHHMRIATKTAIVFVILWSIGNLLQAALVCRIGTNNHSASAPQICADQPASFIAVGMFNVITNMIIIFIPIPTVWGLKVNLYAKFALTGIFLFGILVTIVSIGRIVALFSMFTVAIEVPKLMAHTSFLSTLEVNLSIFCDSCPMVIPLITWYNGRYTDGMGHEDYLNSFADSRRHERIIDHITNGLPLDTIYGKDNVHYKATVVAMTRQKRAKSESHDVSDSESTLGLPKNAQAINIERNWTITIDKA